MPLEAPGVRSDPDPTKDWQLQPHKQLPTQPHMISIVNAMVPIHLPTLIAAQFQHWSLESGLGSRKADQKFCQF
jgi:hypothetical protein